MKDVQIFEILMDFINKEIVVPNIGKNYTDFKFNYNDTILFGRESSGVPKNVHELIKNKLKIPMVEKKRSLNLATSVAIVLAENLRQRNYFK